LYIIDFAAAVTATSLKIILNSHKKFDFGRLSSFASLNIYTVYVQDGVLLFNHLERALCRNKVDMVQLLAEKIEQTESDLTIFIRGRLMQLYTEVSYYYEITKRSLNVLDFHVHI